MLRPLNHRLPLSILSRPAVPLRTFTTSILRKAEGDIGSMRSGGERSGDTWSRREKAAEDMYIKEREKEIMVLLKEKIRTQEKKLSADRKLLDAMKDEYGHQAEVEAEWGRKY